MWKHNWHFIWTSDLVCLTINASYCFLAQAVISERPCQPAVSCLTTWNSAKWSLRPGATPFTMIRWTDALCCWFDFLETMCSCLFLPVQGSGRGFQGQNGMIGHLKRAFDCTCQLQSNLCILNYYFLHSSWYSLCWWPMPWPRRMASLGNDCVWHQTELGFEPWALQRDWRVWPREASGYLDKCAGVSVIAWLIVIWYVA